jgi:hypothetical protein
MRTTSTGVAMFPLTPMHAFMFGSAMYAELYFGLCRALAAPWLGAGLHKVAPPRDVTGSRIVTAAPEATVEHHVAAVDARLGTDPAELGPNLKVVPDDATQVPSVTRGRSTRRTNQARPQPTSQGAAPDSPPSEGF